MAHAFLIPDLGRQKQWLSELIGHSLDKPMNSGLSEGLCFKKDKVKRLEDGQSQERIHGFRGPEFSPKHPC